jgi:hypothetical protein
MRDLFFHQAADQLAFFDHRHEVEPALASSATTCGRGSSGLTRNRQLSIK